MALDHPQDGPAKSRASQVVSGLVIYKELDQQLPLRWQRLGASEATMRDGGRGGPFAMKKEKELPSGSGTYAPRFNKKYQQIESVQSVHPILIDGPGVVLDVKSRASNTCIEVPELLIRRSVICGSYLQKDGKLKAFRGKHKRFIGLVFHGLPTYSMCGKRQGKHSILENGVLSTAVEEKEKVSGLATQFNRRKNHALFAW